jgi:hypothetical protein
MKYDCIQEEIDDFIKNPFIPLILNNLLATSLSDEVRLNDKLIKLASLALFKSQE